MSNLGSSDIRECLLGPDSDGSEIDSGSDIDADLSLEDFSSGSDDDYDPNLDVNIDSDTSVTSIERPSQQSCVSVPSTSASSGRLSRAVLTLQNTQATNSSDDGDDEPNNHQHFNRGTWVRVYPPEPDVDITLEFQVRNPGTRNLPPRNSLPLHYFYLFFTDFIWNMLVRETNLYAEKQLEEKRDSGNLKRFSRLQRWISVTKQEIKRYIGLYINMGLNYKNNYKHYWSTSKSQKCTYISNAMSLNRFQAIRANFHVSSLTNIPKGQPGHDPWNKIRQFYDFMNKCFKKYFIPDQNIAIDESMVGMKNRCSYIQYMPNKRHARFGIKKFELCDSKSSYVLHSELYSGKGFLADVSDEAFTQKVVIHLMNKCNLLDKGYHLFIDNYYTKIPLAEKLLERKTYVTGTINKRSKELSKVAVTKKLAPKETIYFRRNKVLLVGYKQKKTRKPVYLISTALPANDKLIRSKKSGIEAIKPSLINEYNLSMGSIDTKDKSIYHLTCTRPTKKYWKKIFDNFLDMALLNAYLLYKSNTDKPLDRHGFTVQVLEALVEELPVPPAQPVEVGPQGPGGDVGHSLVRLPGVKLRVCIVCSSNNKKSRSHFWCPGCNSGVHPACYSGLQHFWRATGGARKRRIQEAESDSE